ncbi:MAG: S-methyl-5'-thioadenosine phosphorylase [Deltaproteobacteria bacterium]|nr:S-methyl-5'-thioadenosine phosphorylase [Deltaproteobacteria bacterium]
MGEAAQATLGVIGGSGLYDLAELEDVRRIRLPTPFGDPSDEFVLGTLSGVRVAFLPRHARGHRILPGELNFRANIHAMKQLGVRQLVGVGAVGSLREQIAPGDVVVPDQFIDRTFGRTATFFGGGVVAHLQFGDPVCAKLASAVSAAASSSGAKVHQGGTYVCMEGPQFSTRAESNLYRTWGASIIGMTNLQEAKLAREAEICFASLALCTDYDCWHESEAEVDVAAILAVLHANAKLATRTMVELAGTLPQGDCACRHALDGAIVTDRSTIPAEARERLRVIAGKYL